MSRVESYVFDGHTTHRCGRLVLGHVLTALRAPVPPSLVDFLPVRLYPFAETIAAVESKNCRAPLQHICHGVITVSLPLSSTGRTAPSTALRPFARFVVPSNNGRQELEAFFAAVIHGAPHVLVA